MEQGSSFILGHDICLSNKDFACMKAELSSSQAEMEEPGWLSLGGDPAAA